MTHAAVVAANRRRARLRRTCTEARSQIRKSQITVRRNA